MNLTYDDKNAVLDLGDGENRFSPDFLDEIDARLDEVIGGAAEGLVTTAAASSTPTDWIWTG